MRKKSIDNGIRILKLALVKNITNEEVALELGFHRKYIYSVKSDIKRRNYRGEDVDEFNIIWEEYDNKNNKKNGDILNLNKNNNTNKIAKNKTTTEVKDNNMIIDFTTNSNNYPTNHIKTLDELLERCEVDKDIWSVRDYTVNKWDVTSFKSNSPKTIENFQVKARLEKNVEIVTIKELVDIFKNDVKTYKPPKFKKLNKGSFKQTNNLLEICLFDTHFNKLVYRDETNNEYDVEIAEKIFIDTVGEFIERAKVFGFDRILFPVGNDFFNSDGMSGATTAGTPQNNNLLWHDTFRRGCDLIKDAIYLMKDTGVNVDVLMIPGNHDYMNNFFLGEYLYAWFKDDDLVSINNSANPRKYYPYGEVLIGFTHGNEEKRDVLPMLMANEKELWYNSTYREWHLGHYHTKKNYKYSVLTKDMIVDERDDIIIRHLSSLSGIDSWTNKKGYITSNKAGDGFVWSGDKGLIAHININI